MNARKFFYICAGVLLLALPYQLASAAFAAAPTFQGTFTNASLCSPRGIDFSPSGVVFVASDCGSPQHVERYTALGGFLDSWPFPAGFFGSANGLALDSFGNVFATDFNGNRMYKFTNSGTLLASWGTSFAPADVAVNSSGDVFVAALDGVRVQKFTNGGAFVGTIGSAGTGPGQFQEPIGIAVDGVGRIYVADAGRVRVLRFLADGTFDMEFAPPTPVYDMAAGPDGNLYLISFFGPAYQYSSTGTLLQTFNSPSGLNGAFRIAISPTGAIFITEQMPGLDIGRITRFQIDQTTSATRTTFGRLKAKYR